MWINNILMHRSRRRKILPVLLAVLIVLSLAAAVFIWARMQGPYRDYRVDLTFHSGPGDSAPLEVGAAARDITPDLSKYDPWVDVDGNSKFEPRKGDTYEDRNGNGSPDLVWLGGFNVNRPAQGVNDPLWTRAIAFRHGKTTIAIVSIDCVGLTHERFIKARQAIAQRRPDITHVLFSSTHTHNSPDTMGIWSRIPFFGEFDESYVDFILDQTCEAVVEAVDKLEPADVLIASERIEPEGFVRDSRPPYVHDEILNVARFVRAGTDETIATLLSWGNHPEALGSRNPLISSDFVHYWRESVEKGLPEPDPMPGIGGLCVFVQGPVGGLMTPLSLHVPDRDGQTVHKEDGIGKTKALGENLAERTLRLLRSDRAEKMQNHSISGVARTVFVPIHGTFRIPIMLGLIHPGWFGGKARTEINALRIGDIEILALPGEVYPEIIDGGVEAPEGADFPGDPVEVPPLRSEMRGKINMVFNLANDEIGYIIPHTQWDTRSPYTYGRDKAPYGEINSGGPHVAPVIHAESLKLLRELHTLDAPGATAP